MIVSTRTKDEYEFSDEFVFPAVRQPNNKHGYSIDSYIEIFVGKTSGEYMMPPKNEDEGKEYIDARNMLTGYLIADSQEHLQATEGEFIRKLRWDAENNDYIDDLRMLTGYPNHSRVTISIELTTSGEIKVRILLCQAQTT